MPDRTSGGPDAWLLVDGRPVAPLEVADRGRARRRGLLGRDGIDGAMAIVPAASVHTLGMRFTIDVAFCDRSWRVLQVRTMVPGRVSRPRIGARIVIEAAGGSFAHWQLAPGVTLSAGPAPD